MDFVKQKLTVLSFFLWITSRLCQSIDVKRLDPATDFHFNVIVNQLGEVRIVAVAKTIR